MTPSRFSQQFAVWRWPLLGSVLALVACSGPQSATLPVSSGAEVSGEILFPPAAGQVVFEGNAGSFSFALVTFPVRADGLYTVNLPAPSRLPSSGNTNILPLLPDLHLFGLVAASCGAAPQANDPKANDPKASDPSARLVLVSRGSFLLAGKVTGQLLPAAQAIGGFTAQELMTVMRQYAYADRDVRVSGTLNCTYKTSSGGTVGGIIKADYQLKRGWNVLVSQTYRASPAGPLSTSLSVGSAAVSVQWRFWPTSEN